ncbi:MAG: dihydropteroate synthase [Candidatus Rokubacteria bacterium]|nr:dihydropteroate synthase [Candidatus Rokubacteria bacterium]
MTRHAVLGGIRLGDGLPPAVMGVLNVSPESFYRGSVHHLDDLLAAGERMVEAGAAILDVGAMSTAPYLSTQIPESEEAERLAAAVERLAAKLGVPISADTSRAAPTRAALEAGAVVINDVSGLSADPELAGLVARARAGLIVMASPGGNGETPSGPQAPGSSSPLAAVTALLGESLSRARSAGIGEAHVVVDPAIGFFRGRGRSWVAWDCEILARLGELRVLGRPVCVGVSRKSFIGALLGQDDPGERLVGSLAATAVAVMNGAHMIRTHDVAETLQVVRVAQAIRQLSRADEL